MLFDEMFYAMISFIIMKSTVDKNVVFSLGFSKYCI